MCILLCRIEGTNAADYGHMAMCTIGSLVGQISIFKLALFAIFCCHSKTVKRS
jgi:hypothetical protein